MRDSINQTQLIPGKKTFTLVPRAIMAIKPSVTNSCRAFPPVGLFSLPCYVSGFRRFPPDPFPPKIPTQSLADLILTLTYLFSLSKFQVCVPEASLDAGRISSPAPGNFGRVQKWNMHEEFNQKLPM